MDFILITGASTGIGYALSKKFLSEGYSVLGSVRSASDADRLGQELGAAFHPLVFDVTDHQAIEASVSTVKNIIGTSGLAGLINNAGIAVGGTVLHLPVSEFQRQFDVNLFGLIAVTKAFLPMLGATKNFKLRPGKIINISSVSGKIGHPFISPYCASKFAVEGFSESLRRELLLYGIDVITVGPGPINTPIWGKSDTMSDEMLKSDYGVAIGKFRQFLAKSVKGAMDPDVLAERIFKVYRKKHPKTNYIFLNSKFLNYTIPWYFLSSRMMDNMLRKLYQ